MDGGDPQPVLRRTWRRFWRRLRPPAFRLVYHERYNAQVPGVPHDPLRAERILAFLASEGLVLRRCVNRPEPVWLKSLERVHGAGYLDAIHRPSTLTSIMGVEIGADQVDRLIDYQRLLTGGTLMATRRAREHGVGVNLGGGLHHAMADRGGGFCIFNDVAVAIADERRKGFQGQVLVVDLDLHDGDGTREIFRRDASVFTFSVHARHWGEVEAEGALSIELGSGVDDRTYLETLERELPRLVRELEPRLVFYLAGCDPARDDFLGDWRISAGALLARDLLVARTVRPPAGRRPPRRRAPLVILLAGGYGPSAWRYTARFLARLQLGRPIEPPSTEEITLKRYRYLSRRIDPRELSGDSGDEFALTEEDILLPGMGGAKRTRFLDFYSRHGLELILERNGFLDRLRDIGFAHPTLDLQLDDPAGETLRIFGHPDRREVLVELRVRRDRRALPGFELLSVEWLLLQNPRGAFEAGHPRRPGQSHPGLGMLGDVAAMLQVACERLHFDGLVFVASQYHVAAHGHGFSNFLDAEAGARFQALGKLFRDTPLSEATRLVAGGGVVDAASGEVFRWRPESMVVPVSERLVRRLAENAGETESYRFALR